MEKIKIKAKSPNLFGNKIIVPIDGEVSILADGTLEVSVECADILINKTTDYENIDLDGSETKKEEKVKDSKDNADKAGKKDKKADSKTKDESDKDEEEEEEEDDSTPFTKESLEALEIKDLLEILESAEVEPAKYEKFKTKKNLLINFILKNQ